jgi:hypothetical protein
MYLQSAGLDSVVTIDGKNKIMHGCGAVAQATDLSWGWGSSLSIAESYALAGLQVMVRELSAGPA